MVIDQYMNKVKLARIIVIGKESFWVKCPSRKTHVLVLYLCLSIVWRKGKELL